MNVTTICDVIIVTYFVATLSPHSAILHSRDVFGATLLCRDVKWASVKVVHPNCCHVRYIYIISRLYFSDQHQRVTARSSLK